jgi:hypothetical protein
MDDRFTNRVNMINTTIGFCDANAGVTVSLTAFVTALTTVKGKVVLVNGLNQIAKGSTKGVTEDTNLLRKVMQDIALKCGSGTTAFANTTNNNTLKALVDFSERDLNREKKEDIDDVCQGIHDATEANIASLAGFGIVAADVTDLQTAIDLYRIATQNPRQAIITKSQANENAKGIVTDIVRNYFEGVMDKIVDTLKISQNEYWKGYQQARKVIDLGSTTAKVRGTVKNELEVPLVGALFQIFDTGTETLVRQVQTDNVGGFNAPGLPSGDFDFKWSLPGYITKIEQNVHIGPGKELQRKVTLKAGVSTVVREGDVFSPGIVNVPVDGINTTPLSTVRTEISMGPLRAYCSATPGEAPSGSTVFWDLVQGTDITKPEAEFKALVGWSESTPYLNFQNIGMSTAHFKLTFDNLGSE